MTGTDITTAQLREQARQRLVQGEPQGDWMLHRIIGVDPGPTPGLCMLELRAGACLHASVAQCDRALLPTLLWALLEAESRPPSGARRLHVAVEDFVIGQGSRKSRSAGSQTRQMVGQVVIIAEQAGATTRLRSAAAVKPWATDDRLARVGDGLLEPTKTMRHARDAARHALYYACSDLKIPDPLSTHDTGAWS